MLAKYPTLGLDDLHGNLSATHFRQLVGSLQCCQAEAKCQLSCTCMICVCVHLLLIGTTPNLSLD